MSIDSILPAKLNPHPLVTCHPQQSIHEVARLMKRHNVGSSDLYALLSHEISDLQAIIGSESGFEFSKLVA